METYIVGGAVRDHVMGKKPQDIDYLIVGATSDDITHMESHGFRQVGVDFPVYIQHLTGHEYALARVERKTGAGYNGFKCDTQGVTLEQDLSRRDLTINAMAITTTSDNIIDPFNGMDDIKNRILRHVSPAFAEDPVRILRVARFAARLRFNVADETILLMQEMVKNGEVNSLQRERVMIELEKSAMQAKKASQFIRVLIHCGAWQVLFPEISVPTPDHLYYIDKAVCHAEPEEKFKAFMTMLLKNLKEDELEALQTRIVMPSVVYRAAKRYAMHSYQLTQLRLAPISNTVDYFDMLNVANNGGEEFLQFMLDMLFCECRCHHMLDDYIHKAYTLYKNTPIAPELERMRLEGNILKGQQIGKLHHQLRIDAICRGL